MEISFINLNKIIGHGNFSHAFSKIIKRFKNRGYDPKDIQTY